MAIIHELSESLNKEKGGDITPKLGQLYMFCTTQLVKANIRMDNKMIDDVIKILDGLRSAYAQIVPIHDGKAAPGDTLTKSAPQPAAVPQAPPVLNMQPPQAPPQARTTPAPKPANKPATPAAPADPTPLRSGTSAAKFRAANAYNNANR
jgi:flagellar protein FliS